MIERFWVKNFRSLGDVKVNLSNVTVLVGHNGSGKSNIIDTLRFVYDALRLGLDSAIVTRGGMSVLRRWSAKGRPYDVEFGINVRTDEFYGTYTFVLGSEKRGEYSVKSESCLINLISPETNVVDHYGFETDKGAFVRLPQELNPAITDRALILPLIATITPYASLYKALTDLSFYNIFPNELADPQKPENPYPLDEHGSNLASALREMQRVKSPLLEKLRGAVSVVMPDIKDFHVSQIGGYLVTKLLHDMHDEADESRRASFDLSQESDGTLRMLGILVALYQHPSRGLLTLEEPELTIHPGALKALWEEIESAADRSQIILTTHSPDLLDMCDVEQLRVVEKNDGVTQVDHIAENQIKVIQEKLFLPGELMRAQGLQPAYQLELLSAQTY